MGSHAATSWPCNFSQLISFIRDMDRRHPPQFHSFRVFGQHYKCPNTRLMSGKIPGAFKIPITPSGLWSRRPLEAEKCFGECGIYFITFTFLSLSLTASLFLFSVIQGLQEIFLFLRAILHFLGYWYTSNFVCYVN